MQTSEELGSVRDGTLLDHVTNLVQRARGLQSQARRQAAGLVGRAPVPVVDREADVEEGPTKAKTYFIHDTVVGILRGGLTTGEQTRSLKAGRRRSTRFGGASSRRWRSRPRGRDLRSRAR